MSQTATVTQLEPQGEPALELGSISTKRPDAAHLGAKPESDASAASTAIEPGLSSGDETPPHAHSEVQRWNRPIGNIAKLVFTFLSFLIAGMNDAAVGVCSCPTLSIFNSMNADFTVYRL
jgi:hypothetical protein